MVMLVLMLLMMMMRMMMMMMMMMMIMMMMCFLYLVSSAVGIQLDQSSQQPIVFRRTACVFIFQILALSHRRSFVCQ